MSGATGRVGFIGLGNQGAPIAWRITRVRPLAVWARREASMVAYREGGCTVAASPADLARQCPIIGICVVNDDDVRDILLRSDGVFAGAEPGTIICIHSTVLPGTMVDLEKEANIRKLRLLDAPVSGGPDGAEAGTMSILVGGDIDTLEAVREVLASFGSNIFHMGGIGTGQAAKLLNNNLCFANTAMAVHALQLAREFGMDQRVAAEVFAASSGASTGLRLIMNNQQFRKVTGDSSNLLKDIHHLVEYAEQKKVSETTLLDIVAETPDLLKTYAKNREDF
ncbi:NAD(P)-dependent oxidoreductase [Hyphomonas sp.]|uniref:NAD(P)-dependent oxidoreductase n=1 Tax=Hyphomonas sp. TaxID=87 RepID=UPI003002CFAA